MNIEYHVMYFMKGMTKSFLMVVDQTIWKLITWGRLSGPMCTENNAAKVFEMSSLLTSSFCCFASCGGWWLCPQHKGDSFDGQLFKFYANRCSNHLSLMLKI